MPQRRCIGFALLLISCGGERPAQDRARASESVTASADVSLQAPAQDTAFVGTTEVVDRRRPRLPPGVLRATHAAAHTGYDRVVFEFADTSLPGYHVEYARRAVRRCGSGDLVALAGAAQLVVRFDPARAHDEAGNPTVSERESTPGLPAVRDMKLVCDFEGQVAWALGVSTVRPYRVTETGGRLVLDVRHGP